MRASTRCSSEIDAPAASTGTAPAVAPRFQPVLTTTPSAPNFTCTLAIAADAATTRSAAAARPQAGDTRHQRDGDATGVALRTT